MESAKDRIRLALALLVVEHCSTTEQVLFALTGLRAQVLGQREARQALRQCIDDAPTAAAAAAASDLNVISQLNAALLDAQSQHARQLEERDLEIQALRAQLDLGSSTPSSQTAQAAVPPPFKAAPNLKPKSKRNLAREAAIVAFEQSLRPELSTSTSTAEPAAEVAATAASDLRLGHSVIDAIASYRAAVKSAVPAAHQRDRVSLLSRAAARVIRSIALLLEIYTSPADPSAKPDGSCKEGIRQNVAEVFPLLIDVLRWCASTTDDFAQWACKLARQHHKEPRPGIEGACESLLNAVSVEMSTLTRQCIAKIVSHSIALQDTLDSTFAEQHSSQARLKTKTAALQHMIDADVRYRLLHLLDGVLVQPSQSLLQSRVVAQSLLLLLRTIRDLCRLPPVAHSDQPTLSVIQPRRDALVLLLPLATNLAGRLSGHQSVVPFADAAVKEARDTLSDMVTDQKAWQALEERFGGTIKGQLLKLLEELLLTHSVADYSRLINLAPIPIVPDQCI